MDFFPWISFARSVTRYGDDHRGKVTVPKKEILVKVDERMHR
jgi:putative transposon-encoded protein